VTVNLQPRLQGASSHTTLFGMYCTQHNLVCIAHNTIWYVLHTTPCTPHQAKFPWYVSVCGCMCVSVGACGCLCVSVGACGWVFFFVSFQNAFHSRRVPTRNRNGGGLHNFDTARNIIFENNTAVGIALGSFGSNIANYNYWDGYTQHLYFARNSISHIWGGDRECKRPSTALDISAARLLECATVSFARNNIRPQ
jgi:hypothetical protein